MHALARRTADADSEVRDDINGRVPQRVSARARERWLGNTREGSVPRLRGGLLQMQRLTPTSSSWRSNRGHCQVHWIVGRARPAHLRRYKFITSLCGVVQVRPSWLLLAKSPPSLLVLPVRGVLYRTADFTPAHEALAPFTHSSTVRGKLRHLTRYAIR